jgi:hypothetical protein
MDEQEEHEHKLLCSDFTPYQLRAIGEFFKADDRPGAVLFVRILLRVSKLTANTFIDSVWALSKHKIPDFLPPEEELQ